MTKKLKSFIKHFNKLDHILIFDQNKDISGILFKKWLNLYTEAGSSVVIIVAILLVALLDSFTVLYIFLPIYLFQLGIVELIKLYFNRTRPPTYKHTNLLGISTKSGSFPSGHTSNAFCFAYLTCNYYQVHISIILVAYALAAAIGMSRILLGKHFFGDVLAGAIIGVMLAIMGTFLWITIYDNFNFVHFTV